MCKSNVQWAIFWCGVGSIIGTVLSILWSPLAGFGFTVVINLIALVLPGKK